MTEIIRQQNFNFRMVAGDFDLKGRQRLSNLDFVGGDKANDFS